MVLKEEIELKGKVKWFNNAKGYCQNGTVAATNFAAFCLEVTGRGKSLVITRTATGCSHRVAGRGESHELRLVVECTTFVLLQSQRA